VLPLEPLNLSRVQATQPAHNQQIPFRSRLPYLVHKLHRHMLDCGVMQNSNNWQITELSMTCGFCIEHLYPRMT
jgi:hypothetical protein